MKFLLLALILCTSSGVLAATNDWRSLMLNRPFQLKPSSRVSGGDGDTSLNYQFQVQIADLASGQHICGAVMIDTAWALTAAHCVVGRDITRLSVPIDGDHDGRLAGTPYQAGVKAVRQVVVHPSYSPSTLANNIALVQLAATMVVVHKEGLPRATRTVLLPEQGQKFTDEVTLIGFGSISNRVPREESGKRIVSLPMAALTKCRNLYGQNLIASGMLCAGDSYTGKGLCQGDSGSGLSQFDSELNAEVLVGIGSFGFECGNGRFPSVFTEVANYVNWIRETVPAPATTPAPTTAP